jgi:hypothetical protein
MPTTNEKSYDVTDPGPKGTNEAAHRDEPRRKLVVRLLPAPGKTMAESAAEAAEDLIKRGCEVFTLDCRSLEAAPPPAEIRSKFAAHMGLPPAAMPANPAEYGEVDPANPPRIDGDGEHKKKIAEIVRDVIAAADQMVTAAEADRTDDETTFSSFYNALEAARKTIHDGREEYCTTSCCNDCHRLYHAAERLVRTWDALGLIVKVPNLAGPAQDVWEDAVHAAAEILWLSTGQNAA